MSAHADAPDLNAHDEIHDVWGNRGEPDDMYGQKEERQ